MRTWIWRSVPDCPIICLDAIREELDEAPTGNQGNVIHQARERAREFFASAPKFRLE
jgi:predicted kinase